MNILIIDDMRSDFDIIKTDPLLPNNDNIVIARTYEMGKLMLASHKWDILYLDHDLGGHETGYDLMCLLEYELAYKGSQALLPTQVICVSSNPVGRAKIEQAWKQIVNHLVSR